MAETLTILTSDPATHLVGLTIDDAPEFFDLYDRNRYRIEQFSWGASGENRTLAQTHNYLGLRIATNIATLGVVHKRRISGYVSVSTLGTKNFIAYWMDKDLRGQDIMTQCVSATTDWAHPICGDIYADIDPANSSSIGVVIKSGFIPASPDLETYTRYVKQAPDVWLD